MDDIFKFADTMVRSVENYDNPKIKQRESEPDVIETIPVQQPWMTGEPSTNAEMG